MTKRTLVALFIAAPLLLLAATSAASQEKPRVAVLQINNQTQWWGNDLGNSAASLLTTRLVNNGTYSVVERSMIDAIIEEQGFQLSGAVNPRQAAEIGKIAGVQYMLVGDVSRFSIETKKAGFGGIGAEVTEAESQLTVRAIHTETAEIVAAAEAEGKKRLVGFSGGGADFSSSAPYNQGLAEDALSPAIDDLVEKLADRKDAMAHFDVSVPANIVGQGSGGSVYIDKGENFGVEVGDRYNVLRVVDEIVDADGNVLDRITDVVGVLEVERVLSQSSVARIVEGEAQEGDTLRPAG